MRYVLVCLALMFATRIAEAEKIVEIVVEENSKTTSATVESLAKIEVGDNWSPDMGEGIKRNLVSSGLFKDVEVFTSPAKDGVKVHILAKDKHSWVIAPAIYNQPTNKGGGIGFGENNLFGQNQKLLIYGQVATGDSFFIGAWVIPAIGGTRFSAQFDTFLKTARNIEYAAPTKWIQSGPDEVRHSRIHYLNGGMKLGMGLFKGIRIEGRLRGAKVSYVRSKTQYRGPVGEEEAQLGAPVGDRPLNPGKEGWDVSNEWTLSVDRRANWYGVQSGYKYTAVYEYALPKLGSDFHYWLANVNIMRAWQVLKRHNYIIKMGVNYGHHLPFQQEFKTGGTSMRGYLNDQFRGDFKASMNMEYSVPMITVKGLSIRGLLFVDSAYTTFLKTDNPERNYLPNAQVRGLDGFRNSVGAGTRFYLRQIVLPLLGLDFGYGLEANDFQIYLAIGLTD
ncbi:MAG: BamA/TamA family outer membrane protein [Deltaproteobacteria bacterium]|nr:BamA/TamA family outer membrane protein [Deltaproteobacteria bacterium]